MSAEWIKTAKVGEDWKEAPGGKGLYFVSSFGRVYSAVSDKILKGNPIPGGYLTVAFHVDGRQETKAIHRLVCRAFHENPFGKPMINHIDGNTKNNHVDNLEWATAKENTQNGVARGTITGFPRTIGEERRRAIVDAFYACGVGKQKIADRFGVSKKFVQNLVKERGHLLKTAPAPVREDA